LIAQPQVWFAINDIKGRLIATYNNPDISNEEIRQVVDVSTYATGLYIITMNIGEQSFCNKFVKI
jgi:hypothetical protein